MRILVADKFPLAARDTLAAAGFEIDVSPQLSGDSLAQALVDGQAEVLVVRSTKVTQEVFERCPSLSLVVRAGAGVNTIDRAAASRYGVFVANCPGKNAIAVAELTFGLLLALDRQIPAATSALKSGVWDKKTYGAGRGLYGRRLGLLGFGAIAREVAARGGAFGMQVSAFTPRLDAGTAAALGATAVATLDELLRTSDVLSVHVPYSESTHHLVGAEQLARLPDQAIVLHTARGGVVDDEALAQEVRSGRLRAGLDVFEGEPSSGRAEFAHPLLAAESGFCGTPHIGASTAQAEAATADEVIRIITDFASRGVVHNVVNVLTDRPARCTVVVRHLDRVGVLAGVLDTLRREGLNVQQMQNVVFSGSSAAACATIALECEPSSAVVSALQGQADVLAVDIRAAR
ncbi:MAG: hydroxyacid dehydrogenase [Myxococcales bacterium FL481]|nr:MAG: hydroxyacid dehydrogenase [Myxococcales bacterium FL481]